MKPTIARPRRRSAEPAPPPPPQLPDGMLDGRDLFAISDRCAHGSGSNDDVKRLLDHCAAADRLLALLYSGVRQGETARAHSYRAPRHLDGWKGIGITTTREAIEHLSIVMRQPDGAVAAAALGRLKAATLREASLSMVIDGVPDSAKTRDWLRQRAEEFEKGTNP